ncbi:MAG: hypothetical protein A2Z57_10865 [Planctomycetes bacterium RIFCSPHIGHO2_12_39_6]|nr:MAG: hypothetical protein A2Z57_10865 [Planctomycetes bacterium RIFCSPHIGHO2_12_39_6]
MAIGIGGAILGGFAQGATNMLNRMELEKQEKVKQNQELEMFKTKAEYEKPGLLGVDMTTGETEMLSLPGPTGKFNTVPLRRPTPGFLRGNLKALPQAIAKNPELFSDIDRISRTMVVNDLWGMGYKNLSLLGSGNTEQIRKTKSLLAASNVIIDRIDDLTKPLFTKTATVAQWMEGAGNYVGTKLKTNDAAQLYDNTKKAFVSNLARAIGSEKGVLTDYDVDRMLKAYPNWGDSVEVRDSKIAEMRMIASDIAARNALSYTEPLFLTKEKIPQKGTPPTLAPVTDLKQIKW